MANSTTKTKTKTKTVFERIGGMDAVNAAVDIFYKKVLDDTSINHFFKGTDMEHLRGKQKSFLAMAFGGPVKYTGNDMRTSHADLVKQGLNEDHFNAVAGHLVDTLNELNVPQKEIDEIVTIALSVKDDVLGLNGKTETNENDKTMALGSNMDTATAPAKSKTKSKAKENGVLTSSGNAYEQILDQALDGVVTINSKKEITFFNKAAEGMWGYSREEVLGLNIKEIVPDEIQADHDGYVEANMKTGKNKIVGTSRDVDVQRKDGTRFAANLSLTKVVVDGEVQYTAFVKDITEQKRIGEEQAAAEEELRQSMEEVQAQQEAADREKKITEQTLEQALDGIVTINEKKEITFFNKAAETMWGYSREEVLGNNIKTIVPDEIKANHDGYVEANMKTGVNKIVGQSRDVEIQRKDGTRFWANLSLSKVETGGILQYTAFVKDITQERQEKQKNIAVLEQAVDGVVTIGADKKITFFNKAAETMWGYSREEVLGNNIKTIVPDEIQANHDGYVDANIKTGINKIVGMSRDVEIQRKDGTRFWANLALAKVEVGDDLQYTAFVKDITQERQEKQKNIAVLEQAVDGVVTIGGDKKITFFNKAAERMWGYSREEVLGNNIKTIVPDEIKANHDGYVDANIKTGINKIVGTSRDVEIQRKDGTRFWANLALAKVEVGGELQYTAFVKDITQERQEKKKNIEILEQAIDGVITINSDKTIQFFNKAAEKMWGYSREEVLGKNVKEIVPDELKVHHDGYVDANIKTGVNKIVGSGRDVEIQRKDGSRFWANLSIAKVEVDGEIQYTAFAKDIQLERENKLQAESVTTAVDTGWASIEFEPDGTIITANKNFVNTLGYSDKSELVGNHHRMFCENSYAKSAKYNDFWKNLANGETEAGEFQLVKKDGAEVWIQASYTPVRDAEGIVYKVIAIATNISEVKFPVMQVSQIISELAKGNLTSSFDMDAEGYVKEMGDALNVAMENLNGLLGDIGESSNLLAASSEQMLTKSDQMKGTTQEVASAIGQMAEGVQQQAQQIDETSKLLEGVRVSSNDMGGKADTINKAAEEGQSSAKEGLVTVKKVVDSMSEIQDSAKVTSESIEVLTERSEEIARTLNVITDIAAQTNLLALNAAIEAARAGEAGRGFAVVAEEIRKLAEDSRTSAGDIEKVISAVAKDIASAGKAIGEMDSSVKEGNTAATQAEEVFKKIDESTLETLGLSKEVLEATDEQKTSIGETVKNIEKIVVVSEETAAGTEEIATSSKDLNNGMDEFNSTSKGLTEIANQLQEGVSKFTLKVNTRK